MRQLAEEQLGAAQAQCRKVAVETTLGGDDPMDTLADAILACIPSSSTPGAPPPESDVRAVIGEAVQATLSRPSQS